MSFLFGKKHRYETLGDLLRERSTPEEIIRTDPKDISRNIKRNNPSMVRLSELQELALDRLLSLKELERKSKLKPETIVKNRENTIAQFLQNQPEVDALIVEKTTEVEGERIKQKILENRLRALRDEPIIPYTPEEQAYKQLLERKGELGKGGKRTRKYRRGSKRRFNKKASRKNKKRSTHKRKH